MLGLPALTRAAILLVVVTASVAVHGETRFLAVTSGVILDVDVAVGRLGEVRAAVPLPGFRLGNVLYDLLSAAGGRYVVWRYPIAGSTPARSVVIAIDRATNTGLVTPGSILEGASGTLPLYEDAIRPRVFAQQGASLAVIDLPSMQIRGLALPVPLARFRGLLDYAARADTAVVRGESGDVVLVHLPTMRVRELPIRTAPHDVVFVDTYARRLLVLARFGSLTLTMYDLQTSAITARVSPPYDQFLGLDHDVVGDRLLMHLGGTGFAPAELVVFDGRSLEITARVPLNAAGSGPVASFRAAAVGPYVALIMPACDRMTMHAIDRSLAGSTTTVSPFPLWQHHLNLSTASCAFSTRLTSEPAPPRRFTAAVDGRTVQLSWEDPGDATAFEIEAGTGPGRSDLGILPAGAGTEWAVGGVPSGTYYARVYGVNHLGRSAPSADVVIRVQ